VGSLRPAFDLAATHGAGVFVLALTSNPEGPEVQHARAAGGRTVAQTVIDEISQLNRGATGLGSFGLVVGATIGDTGHDLSGVNGPLLAPGLGAQGGDPEGLSSIFGESLRNVLPSYSREVLSAGPETVALQAAADRAVTACRAVIG
jgi:orotidine-5'-phosphate decarboxylase